MVEVDSSQQQAEVCLDNKLSQIQLEVVFSELLNNQHNLKEEVSLVNNQLKLQEVVDFSVKSLQEECLEVQLRQHQ